MNTVKEYLRDKTEPTPQWLLDFKPGDKLNAKEIFRSRIVYYPGSGYDGQAIRTFNNARFAHVFINVDYLVKKEAMIKELSHEKCLKGYSLLDIQELPEDFLFVPGWKHTVPISKKDQKMFMHDTELYCLAAVYERKPDFDDEHGAERILVFALSADGIASYDAIFGNRLFGPSALIIQDHGFGCNWASFGKYSILEFIARKSNTMPEYICVVDGNCWSDYEKVENLAPEIGGMWANRRFLYKHSDWSDYIINSRYFSLIPCPVFRNVE